MNVLADTSRDLDVRELLARLKRHVSPAGSFLMKRVEDEVNTISTQLVGFKAVMASPSFTLPVEQRLTTVQARIFTMLSQAGARGVTIAGLAQGLYADLPECDQPEDPNNVIKVHIHHIRKRLRGSRYGIVTIWGRGFRLIEDKTGTRTSEAA